MVLGRTARLVLASLLTVVAAMWMTEHSNAQQKDECPVDRKTGVPMIRALTGACIQDDRDHKPTEIEAAKIAASEALAAAIDGDEAAWTKYDEKQALVSKLTGESPRPPLRNATSGGGAQAMTGWVNVTVYQQINGNYCGPATAQTILRFLGPQTSVLQDPNCGWCLPTLTGIGSNDQPILANSSWLETDSFTPPQTPWGSSYMPYTLNAWRGSLFYVQSGTPNVGGSLNQTTAWSHINSDMTAGYPVAENVKYNGTSYYPGGFAPGVTYEHWDVIYGNFEVSGLKYIQIAQVFASVGYTWVPYYSKTWNSHWPAIGNHHGIVW